MAQENGRSALKAQRREQLLHTAAGLFAARGFHGVRLEDIGTGAGISGPAVYRHFPSKEAVLTELLVDISEHLHAGGARVVAAGAEPEATLRSLVDFHLDFTVHQPELIRIQDRDFASLPDDARARVRCLQKDYIELWAAALRGHRPGLDQEAARVRVQGVFGLLNSTPHLGTRLSAALTRRELGRAALAALQVEHAN